MGQEIFLIKTYNEKGDQIGLSIEKNDTTQAMELIIEDVIVGVLVNSSIYNFDMVEIGKMYRGEYSQKKINNFWQGVDHHEGNISIYDHTGIYKIGSFMFKQEVDYYEVLGIDRIDNVDSMDARTLKKNIRNTERFYKKLIKKYDLKRNPNDQELREEFEKVAKAYEMVMSDLGVDVKGDDKFLGFIPSDYVSEERRSQWSQDEGYVPYTKREIKGHQPDSKIQKDELYLEDKD